MTMMKKPPHPGKMLKIICLEPLGLSITEAAKILDMPRSALSELVNGKRGITPNIALKLGKAFNQSADFWMRAQAGYDLANADPSCADKVVVYSRPKYTYTTESEQLLV